MNSAAARDAGALLATASDFAARVTRDLSELRRILDRAGSEEEADFVGEIAGEFEEFAQHLAALNEKRAEQRSRALKCLTAAPQSPGLSE
jgi:ABC-type transporter Mla subunit MlaD